jgi:hypothetical protein
VSIASLDIIFEVIWKNHNFVGSSTQFYNFGWSRTSRKCRIQKEYRLYLHPPFLGGLECIFQPLAQQNLRADLQIDGRVPVSTVSTFAHPSISTIIRMTAVPDTSRRSTQQFLHLCLDNPGALSGKSRMLNC